MPEFGVSFNYDDGGISKSIADQAEQLKRVQREILGYDKSINNLAKDSVKALNDTEKALGGQIKTQLDSISTTEKKLELSKKSMEDFGNVSRKAFLGIKEFVFGNLIANGITGLISSFVNLGKSIISAGANFEKTTVTFTNAFGDKKLAEDYISLIQNFAKTTPFEFDKLTASVLKLTNRGFTPTTSELTKLGDLAATTGKDFDQLTEAILDAQTGEFERLKEFGIRASKDGDKVTLAFKGQIKEIQNTEVAIREAIIAYGSLEGVQGTMAVQSKTFEGVMSNLKDTLTQISIKIFTAFGPTLTNSISFLTEKLGSVTQIVTPLWESFDNLFATVFNGTSATDVLGKAWEYVEDVFVVTVKAVSLLVDGLSNSIKWVRETSKEASVLGSSFRFVGGLISKVVETFLNMPAILAGIGAAIKQFYDNVTNFNFDVGIGEVYDKEYAKIKASSQKASQESKALSENDSKTETEILKRRNENRAKLTKQGNDQAIKALKDYQKEIASLQNQLDQARKNNIDESTDEGKIVKIQETERLELLALEKSKQITLETISDAKQRATITEIYRGLELEINRKYNKELDEVAAAARKRFEDDNAEYLKQWNDRTAGEREAAEKAKTAFEKDNEERLRDLEKMTEARRNQQIQRLEDEIKYGNLSVNEIRQKELEKQEIYLETLKVQRAAISDPFSEKAIELDTSIESITKQVENLKKGIKPAFKDFKDFASQSLTDAFNLPPGEAEKLIEGFEALKGAILDVVNAGYEAELDSLDKIIDKRKDRISELEGLIEEEYQKKQNGYANSYDALSQAKKAEEDLLKADNKKRIDIKKSQLKAETQIQAAEQGAALITAVANMVKDGSKFGIFGLPLIAAGIIGLFALFASYKAKAKAIAAEQVYKGGLISDYIKNGETPKTDRWGYGGHEIEGTNLKIGADEFVVNANTTAKHLPFLKRLNSGSLDTSNLMKMLENSPNDRVIIAGINNAYDKKELENKIQFDKSINDQTEKIINATNEQTKKLIEDNSRRPTVIHHTDGTIETIHYEKNGTTRRIKKP